MHNVTGRHHGITDKNTKSFQKEPGSFIVEEN
jgi:hypothetical protein